MTKQNHSEVDYPLKEVSQLLDRDAPCFLADINTNHDFLKEIKLHTGVPRDIRQLFETSKNLALYSHYAYRFHQIAEMVAYSSLEWALRERAKSEHPELFTKKKPPALNALAKLAIDKGWASDNRMPSRRLRAERAAQYKIIYETMHERLNISGEFLIPEPTEAEIIDAQNKMRITESFLNDVSKMRNNLAHGSSTLMPSSFETLQTISEIINQIFAEPL